MRKLGLGAGKGSPEVTDTNIARISIPCLPAWRPGTELPGSLPPALIIQGSQDQREMGVLCFFFPFIQVWSICKVVLLSSIQQSDIFCRLKFITGYDKVLSVVPSSIQ